MSSGATASNTRPRPRTSVLICTRDRPSSLQRCLHSILASEHDDFEVMVVDQSTTHETEVLVHLITDVRIGYLRLLASGLSDARNAGVQQTRGHILAFTDDDCVVSTTWLRCMEALFAGDEEVGLIFGAFQAAPHNPQAFFVPSFLPTHHRRLKGIWATRCNDSEAGGNMAIRRAVYDAVGPFDPCLSTGGTFFSGEDSDYFYRTLRAGFAVVHDPESIVIHWGMRAYADGSARRLLLNGNYARGAVLAKELRCHNPVALYIVARLLLSQGGGITRALLKRQRVTGAGQFVHLVRGFYRGLRHPLDRRQQLFQKPEGLAPASTSN